MLPTFDTRDAADLVRAAVRLKAAMKKFESYGPFSCFLWWTIETRSVPVLAASICCTTMVEVLCVRAPTEYLNSSVQGVGEKAMTRLFSASIAALLSSRKRWTRNRIVSW